MTNIHKEPVDPKPERATYTAVFLETDSDAPPLYPDPLIYTVEIDGAAAMSPGDLASAISAAAEAQRTEEADFESTLTLRFAFPGDLFPVVDCRG